jgi:hypothetical protein
MSNYYPAFFHGCGGAEEVLKLIDALLGDEAVLWFALSIMGCDWVRWCGHTPLST